MLQGSHTPWKPLKIIEFEAQVKTGNLNDVKNEVIKEELEIIDNVNDWFKLYPSIPYPYAPTFADLITRNRRECANAGQQSEWVCEYDENKIWPILPST